MKHKADVEIPAVDTEQLTVEFDGGFLRPRCLLFLAPLIKVGLDGINRSPFVSMTIIVLLDSHSCFIYIELTLKVGRRFLEKKYHQDQLYEGREESKAPHHSEVVSEANARTMGQDEPCKHAQKIARAYLSL